MAVGSRCAWAAANVGAVLTQHRTDPRLGPKVLERLRDGSSPEAVIHDLESTDPDLKWRQLAVVAAAGIVTSLGGCGLSSGPVSQLMKKIEAAATASHPTSFSGRIWLYIRFSLSFRDVEDLLAERGITVSYETRSRRWVNH